MGDRHPRKTLRHTCSFLFPCFLVHVQSNIVYVGVLFVRTLRSTYRLCGRRGSIARRLVRRLALELLMTRYSQVISAILRRYCGGGLLLMWRWLSGIGLLLTALVMMMMMALLLRRLLRPRPAQLLLLLLSLESVDAKIHGLQVLTAGGGGRSVWGPAPRGCAVSTLLLHRAPSYH